MDIFNLKFLCGYPELKWVILETHEAVRDITLYKIYLIALLV